jgi:hypothetical protein
MKPFAHRAVDQYRVRQGPLASEPGLGNNGAFLIPHKGRTFTVIVSDTEGWDHVSISLRDRCPTWSEMCHFKDLFFDHDEPAMQLHPPKSEHVNFHRYCLHLWRSQGTPIPSPPAYLVGPKE